MPNQNGTPAGALTVAVDSIVVGARHRMDAGDLDALATSIDQLGLLQPITVTPDRVLVCGWRRLEAVKRLGWKSIKVWVRSGISDPVTTLLAERDENTQRKDYTPLEKEALYREIKELLREDAARRQAETRFGGTRRNENKNTGTTDADGGVHWTPPGQPDVAQGRGRTEQGKVREQAALIVTGRKSQNTLERLGTLVDLSHDATRPDHIRSLAAEALARIQDGHSVYPEYEAVRAALAATDPNQQTIEPVTAADVQELLATVKKNSNHPHATVNDEGPVESRESAHPDDGRRNAPPASLRHWASIWPGLKGWTTQYDPAVIAANASETDWTTFREVLAETNAFASAAQAARSAKGPHPR
jgi:ParB family chromosome partitioning protein